MIRLNISDSAAASSNCKAILRQPIFRGYVPEAESFILESEDDDVESLYRPQPLRSWNLGRGVQENDFAVLSKTFLAFVNMKDQVLNVADFKAHVNNTVENCHRWDEPSCQVMVACALAYLASPFQSEINFNSTPESNSLAWFYFNQAFAWFQNLFW
ncbi:vegetative cell wall protein gp1 [Colletotrichum orchidophilum]|uniref:Vegetative cell wall protein gp1 n=1 Tax=Colletotrichum orchidophilum TaxID=1209926 RepID=A0A1G4B0V0_9PEZI|nr:vegetative cell wall protein gp1 [Colletotrichum orchidophilum]OHE95011.1 vegetative cell wall protein gp1 [Colletotrichum orchidophilum]